MESIPSALSQLHPRTKSSSSSSSSSRKNERIPQTIADRIEKQKIGGLLGRKNHQATCFVLFNSLSRKS
jgi:hypothetical protein